MTDIHKLLERYWQGETTLQEEALLRQLCQQAEVPAPLQPYADYFRSLQAFAEVESPAADGGAVRSVKAQPLTFAERMRPYFRAAACVAIVMMVGGSIERGVESRIADRRARLAQQAEQTDSVFSTMETLLGVQTQAPTAAADSVATTLPY